MGIITPCEELWDRPLGGEAEGKRISPLFGNVVWVLAGGFCKLLFRYRVRGRENLRAFKGRSGVLVVANHTSYLDVLFMYLAARPAQWVRFLGRDSLFKAGAGALGQMLSRVGAFPIKRDAADRQALKRAARLLKNGEVVGILPEGTRRGKGSLEPQVHAGAAFIARSAKVPILPMTVRNAEKIKQKGKMIHFPTVTVEYGTPILLSDFDFLPKAERLEACSWYAMRECFALFQQVPAAQVDMRALFPEGKDYSEIFAAHPLPVHDADEVARENALLAEALVAAPVAGAPAGEAPVVAAPAGEAPERSRVAFLSEGKVLS